MVSREELLAGIRPGMKLDKNFFLRIYGYELTYPGFKETAIRALEGAGCTTASAYYDQIIGEYERQRNEEIRPVAAWYARECNRKWEQRMKGGEEVRELTRAQLLAKKKALLKLKLQKLTEN